MNGGLILIIIGIISICVGMVIGIRLLHNPIIIEFKISMFDSFMQAVIMFYMITVAMVVEMGINQGQLLIFNPVSWQLRLLSQLIDAGLIVALMLPLLSILFGKLIRTFDMDLSTSYSEKIIKVYFSLVAAANCIWYLSMIGPNIMNDNLENRNILSRVIIWILNILGTWMGIGFHCKSRIDEEIEYDYKSRESLTWKEYMKYGIPFGVAFILNCALLVVQSLKLKIVLRFCGYCYIIVMVGLLGMLCVAIGCKIIENPSEKKSSKKLIGAIKRANAGKCVEGRYRSIKYKLVNEERSRYLEIQKKNVIWEGHASEVENLFGKRKVPMEKFEYINCRDYLGTLFENRRKYIQDGYATCRKNTQQKIRNEKLRVIK